MQQLTLQTDYSNCAALRYYGTVCVCSLTPVILWPVPVAVEELRDHPSTLILLHHQLPSISPTGVLYDVCQLITSDSI